MASLVVRNLDPKLVAALKQRAVAQGRSAEAEHRLILEQALLQARRRNLAQVLAERPGVGEDRDFERVAASERPDRVFTSSARPAKAIGQIRGSAR
jgi:plasmid stability protein